jgi:glycosyltransferase involved in cell wall biosynthesis
LRDAYPQAAERLSLCENGVAPEFLAIERPAPTDRPPRLITVGSLIPRKGIDVLLRALAGVALRPWTFHIVGAGPEEAALRALAGDLGIAARVEFLGHRPPEAIPALLAEADVFLLGSHSEGRPNALVEAMAAGLPVVASRIDGITELLREGESGLLPGAGQVDAWRTAIDALLADAGLRTRLGEGARARVRELGLDWHAAAARYVALYRAVAQG